MAVLIAAQALSLLVLPFVIVGVINRVKALWSGRRGPPILQLAYDVARLLRKAPVYSATTTPIFRLAPYVVLVTALLSGAIVPVLGARAPVSFPFDFVWFAYVWGLGRVALMLGALDTGSAFEGMGASREATYAAILEPALFLVAGALCLVTGQRSLAGALALHLGGGAALVVWLASLVALLIVVQVEAARMPVDDPTTHLELTMIHEVMVLDHSGPELAAIQTGAAVKLTVGVSIIAALLNPWAGSARVVPAAIANVLLCVAVAALLGSVESLVARLKLRAVPQYIVVALVAGGVALLATTWRMGGQG
jgi:formate hydrogenlyase subunit 4